MGLRGPGPCPGARRRIRGGPGEAVLPLVEDFGGVGPVLPGPSADRAWRGLRL